MKERLLYYGRHTREEEDSLSWLSSDLFSGTAPSSSDSRLVVPVALLTWRTCS